jgi:hypothetical protein
VIDPTRTYTSEEAERIFEAIDAYFVTTALECLAIALVITMAFFAAVIGIARAKEWWDSYRGCGRRIQVQEQESETTKVKAFIAFITSHVATLLMVSAIITIILAESCSKEPLPWQAYAATAIVSIVLIITGLLIDRTINQ